MPEITYRIIAVRERERLVSDLLSSINMSDEIVNWDEAHNGAVWNSYRTWNADYKTSHLCILNDDADVVDGFTTLVEKCVNRCPDAIWTFFSNQFDKEDVCDGQTPYIELLSKNVRGICVVIPVVHLKKICAFYDKFLRPYAFKEDDRTIGMYAFFYDVPVMTTVPNLVCAKDVKSTFAGYHKTLNSNCWQGKQIDFSLFETNRTKQLVCRSCCAADTSLPSGCDLRKILKAKYSQCMNVWIQNGVQCLRGGGNYRLARLIDQKKGVETQ